MTRPLSNISLALNRPQAANAFDPDDFTLLAWYDPSNDGNTASGGEFSNVVNLTEDVTSGVGDLDNFQANVGSGAGDRPTEETSDMNGLTAMGFDASARRNLCPRESPSAAKDYGTGAFRIFIVMRQVGGDAWDGTVMVNGAADTNTGATTLRSSLTTAGNLNLILGESGQTINVEANVNVFADEAPHVIMIGRKIGGGTGGIDRYTVKVDNEAVPGITDNGDFKATGTIGCSNNTHPVVTSGRYLIVGGAAAAPPANAAQRFLDNAHLGEIIIVGQDMSESEETAMYTYLSQKWGAVGSSTPAELGAQGWWDFSDESNITRDGSSNIEEIADSTGNGHDMQQVTTADRPSTTTVNGHQMGSFDSSNGEFLDGGTSGIWDPGTDDFTIVGVARRTSTTTNTSAIFSKGSGAARWLLALNSAATSVANANLAAAVSPGTNFRNLVDNEFDYDNGDIYILMAVRDGDNWTLYAGDAGGYLAQREQNTGVLDFNVDPVVSMKIGAFDDVGETFFESFDGEIGECSYFTKALTATERAELFNYLSGKWS